MDLQKAQAEFDRLETKRQAIISQREALAEQLEGLRRNQDSARNQLAIEDLQEQMAGLDHELRRLSPDLEDARVALRGAQIEVDVAALKALLQEAEPARVELVRQFYSLLLASGQAWVTEKRIKVLERRIPSERVIPRKTERLSCEWLFEILRTQVFGHLEVATPELLTELKIPTVGQMRFNQEKILNER